MVLSPRNRNKATLTDEYVHQTYLASAQSSLGFHHNNGRTCSFGQARHVRSEMLQSIDNIHNGTLSHPWRSIQDEFALFRAEFCRQETHGSPREMKHMHNLDK